MSDDHDRIWLEPKGAPERCWCEDNVWGEEAVEYVLVDLVAPPADDGKDAEVGLLFEYHARAENAEAKAINLKERADKAEALIRDLVAAIDEAIDEIGDENYANAHNAIYVARAKVHEAGYGEKAE
jgi:hypothetical protein